MEFHPPLAEILDAMSLVEAIAECLPLPTVPCPDELEKDLQLDLYALERFALNISRA